jgi:hypothetical protein
MWIVGGVLIAICKRALRARKSSLNKTSGKFNDPLFSSKLFNKKPNEENYPSFL